MSFERFRRHEPCSHENCAERSFYVGDDGFTYCRRGHQQTERGTIVAEDTGELIVTGRKHKRADSEAASLSTAHSAITNPQALEVLLLCLQLVLRKQIKWLVQVQRLPIDLEAVVKDLWTLQIKQLKPSAIVDPDTDDSESQMFSSQSESESAGSRSTRSSRRKRHTDAEMSRPQSFNLVDLLALLYVAFLTIRAPVMLADLHDWIASGDLLFYQSSREVPDSLRKRLPGRLQRILDPETWLKRTELQRNVSSKLHFFTDQYGLQIPGINSSVLLFRWTKALALPLEVYVCTHRLTDKLGLNLAYNPEERHTPSRMPETLLMAALVVSSKLLFPLDGQSGQRTSMRSLGVLSMDWNEWYTVMAEKPRPQLSFEQSFQATETQVLDMAEDRLDDYLDWYQRYIAAQQITQVGRLGLNAELRTALISMFKSGHSEPIQQKSEPAEAAQVIHGDSQRLRQVQSQLVQHNAMAKTEDVAAGHYQQFRSAGDLLAPQNKVAERLYTLAATLCATDIKHFVRAVLLVEKRLQQYEALLRGGG